MAKLNGTAKDWYERIHLGNTFKKTYGNSEDWERYAQYYRGQFQGFTPSKGAQAKVLPLNATYAFIRSFISYLYYKNPQVSFSPKRGAVPYLYAKMLEQLVNSLHEDIKLKKCIGTSLLDCGLTSRGIMKVGFDSLYGGPGEGGSGEGDILEYNPNVRPGMPWVTRVSPNNIIVPFGIKDLDEAEWIDHVVLRRLDDVKADERYSNTKHLTATHETRLLGSNSRHKAMSEAKGDNPDEFVEIHEIRDRRRRQKFCLAFDNKEGSGGGTVILEPIDDPLQEDGRLPFADFTFNEDPEWYWGSSDAKMMEPQQLELNETRTQAMFHRRIALLKIAYDTNLVSPEELDKLLSEDVMAAIGVDGDPKDAFAFLESHIPPDLIPWVDLIMADMREMLGMPRQGMGGDTPTQDRMTATKTAVLDQSMNTRLGDRRSAVAGAIKDIVEQEIHMIFNYWSEARVVKMVGFDAAIHWVELKPDELKADYQFSINVESMGPPNKMMQRREIIELLQIMAKMPNAGPAMDYLFRNLASEYTWANITEMLPPAMSGGQPGQPGQPGQGGPESFQQFNQQQTELAGDQSARQGAIQQSAQMMGGMP